jgi:KUP system potassium uptake protein
VYGDIGTSPLYTLKEVFSGHYGVQANTAGVLGVLSLVFWSLIWVVSIKYVLFILRASNQGEGGIMALTALAHRAAAPYARLGKGLVLLGLFGAALFYGDSMITPAISVLSAVEGCNWPSTGLSTGWCRCRWWCWWRCSSSRSTARRVSASCSGRSWCCGSSCSARLAHGIAQRPSAAGAQPGLGGAVLRGPPWDGRGHPGRRGAGVDRRRSAVCRHGPLWPQIARAWFLLVLPGLVLNYFGQGAASATRKRCATRSTCSPEWALLPMVGLATLAIIASQAVISGAFS